MAVGVGICFPAKVGTESVVGVGLDAGGTGSGCVGSLLNMLLILAIGVDVGTSPGGKVGFEEPRAKCLYNSFSHNDKALS